MGLFTKIFGTPSQRAVKALTPLVDKIEALEEEMKALTDQQLRAKTDEFKARLANGETLDNILPEAFAVCREADWRVLGMRPYRVQLIGGIILHQGRIAEMRTGEGKTLVATLPAYLNGLSGKGVHIVTVNDYLAKRDSEWMGKVYRFLGLSVGLVIHGVDKEAKKKAYAADITYGTNNEFGFDYLRDNMAIYGKELVQRGHNFAIVDEVDSILIDEARTPLIISGQGEKSTQLYQLVDNFVARLTCQRVASVDAKEEEDVNIDADYIVDEKARTATLTARGVAKAEQQFNLENLSDPENTTLSHHINQAIKARGVMRRDIDYVVKDGEVIIVDEFTGRLMYGRRYNEGLHQAIEAKEHVTVAHESKTLATITFQNYFRLYDKLSGMTGTAMTEEEEFGQIYSLDIVEIPTNRPVARVDHPDQVYKTQAGKYRAVVRQIKECHEKGQPVLVGTVSIEISELVSKLLTREGIPHNVLNAKHHDKEAEIVAQAGKLGAVTVATNMAGRGTDIMLGGNAEYMAKALLRRQGMSDELLAECDGHADTDNEEILAAREAFAQAEAQFKAEIKEEAEKVREVGGLYILGTERHESRRIDNQLRGRAGRQGDPGESCFFLSLEDDILRLFASDWIQSVMDKLGVDEDTPLDQKMLSNAIEKAQRKVESQNFQIRKTVLEYDDVMNTQREVIYKQRRQVLDGEDVHAAIENMLTTTVTNLIAGHTGEQGKLDEAGFKVAMAPWVNVMFTAQQLDDVKGQLGSLSTQALTDKLLELAHANYEHQADSIAQQLAELGQTAISNPMGELERVILLRVVDEYWMDHIDAMTELRQGIGLRAYGQSDPVVEYKREGYDMFEEMIAAIQEETLRRLYSARIRTNQGIQRQRVAKVTGESGGSDKTVTQQPTKKTVKIGRNDPCPCGSGLKWKKCTCEQYHHGEE
ncbi:MULTISPECIES: preprotein translocase subunit SecA [unclassified Pseudoflavonifractor]|uniref:preprotein translocase subunit SecA n=1 Tax=unclassified Pseudoflavonifractor TaxID=2628103 RepID=UPI000B3A7211|nr:MULTISPECIES: preprotein translocase subunit SecA [unclassified Pseudoflavonifractor]OUN95937.1 preprotein translocase subunit SecA [Pseudoflavonifractor sp. An44]OUP44945.1 preprotein translocase subunit SecA [Pseudoflavonifractor sp. An187]